MTIDDENLDNDLSIGGSEAYSALADRDFKRKILSLATEGVQLLRKILQGVIMADVTLTQLQTDVASETTLEGSILQLLTNVQAALTTALANVTIPAAAQAQIDAIDASIQTNISTLTSAVTANTPAAAVPTS